MAILGRSQQLSFARNLGLKAYKSGKHCSPHADKDLKAFFDNRGHEKYLSLDVHASDNEIIKAYHEGYNSNNSSAKSVINNLFNSLP